MTTDHEAFEKASNQCSRLGDEGFRLGWQAAIESVRKPVSLEKCARALAKSQGFDAKASANFYVDGAKAVLDAAGVAYEP